MPILSQFGQKISEALHTAIYSMPSPDNHHDSGMVTDDLGRGTTLSDFIEEPGEPKAIAGGIGPLSFAGSGYGIMLVLTVSSSAVHCDSADSKAILLNRIHNVVRRPRIPQRPLDPLNSSRYQRARAKRKSHMSTIADAQ
jgi:hypothetical protein